MVSWRLLSTLPPIAGILLANTCIIYRGWRRAFLACAVPWHNPVNYDHRLQGNRTVEHVSTSSWLESTDEWYCCCPGRLLTWLTGAVPRDYSSDLSRPHPIRYDPPVCALTVRVLLSLVLRLCRPRAHGNRQGLTEGIPVERTGRSRQRYRLARANRWFTTDAVTSPGRSLSQFPLSSLLLLLPPQTPLAWPGFYSEYLSGSRKGVYRRLAARRTRPCLHVWRPAHVPTTCVLSRCWFSGLGRYSDTMTTTIVSDKSYWWVDAASL